MSTQIGTNHWHKKHVLLTQKTKYTNTNYNLREMMCLCARGKHDGDNGKAILTLVKWLTGVEWCRGEHPSPPVHPCHRKYSSLCSPSEEERHTYKNENNTPFFEQSCNQVRY